MGGIEEQINDGDGVIFAVYTDMGQPMDIATAYANYFSPYFSGSYFTGQMPPISTPFNPYTAVLDAETMEVINMDTQSTYMTTQDILAAVNGS